MENFKNGSFVNTDSVSQDPLLFRRHIWYKLETTVKVSNSGPADGRPADRMGSNLATIGHQICGSIEQLTVQKIAIFNEFL